MKLYLLNFLITECVDLVLVCCKSFLKNITYTLKNKIKKGFAVSLLNSLIFGGKSLLWSEKFPVIFAGNFGVGRA